MLMKHLIRHRIVMATALAVAILAFILSACSSNGKGFKIDARFLNMNQANFYVYSPDGVISGIDTINVAGGRFVYEKDIAHEGTVVIVFPNFAVMPVFVKPGASISIEANAAHLKDMDIKGTDDNKQFTEWRKNCDKLSPPEMKKHAELFVKDNPKSIVSLWLIRQYFMLTDKPDMKKAQAMLKTMYNAMSADERATGTGLILSRMYHDVDKLKCLNIGDPMPRFTAKDIDGKPVTNGALLKGITVVCVWTTWSYESCSVLRQLATNKQYAVDSARIDHVLTICLDADPKQCRQSLKGNDAESLTTVCDGMMWDSPIVKDLGITTVPYNLKIKNGKIIGRNMPVQDLIKIKN